MDAAKQDAITACGNCGQTEDAHKFRGTAGQDDLALFAALGGPCTSFTASDAAIIYARHLAIAGICGSAQPPGLPDAGDGGCCMGAAVYGPDRCTCWMPVYDLEQRPLKPGDTGLRAAMCADCAYRPGSPERRGDEGYQGDPDSLDEMVMTGAMFACHQGIRRPAKWVHPSGAEAPGHPAGYDPPFRDGKPYKADGAPADLCAGWAARRLKHMCREVRAS